MLDQIDTVFVTATQSIPALIPPSSAPTPAQKRQRRPAKRRSEPLHASSSDAYAKDVRLFKAAGGTIPCNATDLRSYIAKMRNKIAPTTLYRRAMAVRHAHLSLGKALPTDDPAIRPLLRALQLGHVPSKKEIQSGCAEVPGAEKRREPKSAKPITRSLLLKMLDAMHRSSLDRRDRALLLLGFMGALKRAELVSLNLSDLTFTADAMVVTVQGRQIAVPATGGELCAAAATRDWIAHAALDLEQPPGPLFRRFDRGGDPTRARLDAAWVSVIVKNRLKEVGIDPAPFSAQSLRRGRLLEAAKGVL